MGLFKRSRREPAVTTMLRHMERGRFVDASRYVRKAGEDGPPPPPHALWRLGRWLLDMRHGKNACEPFELFLALYPAHGDRPEVMRDLARALALRGKRQQAQVMAERAEQSRVPRQEDAKAGQLAQAG
ncbi:MAG: hypothetical protein O7E54_04575 [Planctomycetota bacterium]|nr:hypothetical protein [Planctomycetota bacterium]